MPPTPTIPFPLGPRASVTEDLCTYLEQTYDIETVTASADLGGTYNLNALITSAKGRFVARVYRPWVTPSRLEALQQLKHYLRAQHLPVVLPLIAPDGRTVVPYEGRVLELEPFIPNSGAVESWERYEKAFALLGRLHSTLARWPAAATLPAPNVENYGTPKTLAAWTKAAQQRIRETSNPDAPEALALCEVSFSLLKDLESWWFENAQHLPQGLIHGDFGVGNLLWRQAEVVAVCDFDFVARHERVFDLAYALFWMFERLEPTRNYALWSWHRIPELLAYYDAASSHPLTPGERRALPFEMARVPLFWVAEAAFLPDPVQAIVSRNETVMAARWLLEHPRELTT